MKPWVRLRLSNEKQLEKEKHVTPKKPKSSNKKEKTPSKSNAQTPIKKQKTTEKKEKEKVERESNTKHLQIISGMSLISYWLSNYVFELVKYFFIGGISIFII